MTMLTPSSFGAGFVCDAVPLSLMLPRGGREQPFLIVHGDVAPVAVFLGDAHRFQAMSCEGNSNWAGMIVVGIDIEVDADSRFDPEENSIPGALVRSGGRLLIGALHEVRYTRGLRMLTVVEGLPPCRERMSVGFKRWSVVLGTGVDRRELMTVDAGDP